MNFGKRFARLLMTIVAIGLFVLAGLATVSAVGSILFGGLFSRLFGYEAIAGSLVAIGIGTTLLKSRPKLSEPEESQGEAE